MLRGQQGIGAPLGCQGALGSCGVYGSGSECRYSGASSGIGALGLLGVSGCIGAGRECSIRGQQVIRGHWGS